MPLFVVVVVVLLARLAFWSCYCCDFPCCLLLFFCFVSGWYIPYLDTVIIVVDVCCFSIIFFVIHLFCICYCNLLLHFYQYLLLPVSVLFVFVSRCRFLFCFVSVVYFLFYFILYVILFAGLLFARSHSCLSEYRLRVCVCMRA